MSKRDYKYLAVDLWTKDSVLVVPVSESWKVRTKKGEPTSTPQGQIKIFHPPSSYKGSKFINAEKGTKNLMKELGVRLIAFFEEFLVSLLVFTLRHLLIGLITNLTVSFIY